MSEKILNVLELKLTNKISMIDHREDPHTHNTDYAKADKAKTKHPPIAIILAFHF